MRLSHRFLPRSFRLLLALLMPLAWSGLPAAAQQPAAETRAQTRAQAAEAMDRFLKMLEAVHGHAPRESFSPDAVVRSVGRDPAGLFGWVRDNTFWVPYQGALRGPVGVLMDRVGGSLDRAMLLAELLRAAGHKPRLMRATLSDEQARGLAGKVRPLPTDGVEPPDGANDPGFNERLRKEAARVGLEPSRLKAAMERSAVESARMAEDTAARVAEQAEAILAAVQAVAPPAAPPRPEPDPTVAALRDHWWVAVDDGATALELDPLLPGAAPGKPAADIRGQAVQYDGRLPADPALCHEVTIQITIERWTGGKREEAPVLRHTLRPADVLGKRVALTHMPLRWPDNINLFGEADIAGRLKELAARPTEWVPTLTVGADSVTQGSFDPAGRVDPKPALNPTAMAGASAGKSAKDAASLLDADAPAEAPAGPQGVLTAEWIDFEVRAPGRPPLKSRRQLFDLVGPAVRAKGAAPPPPDDARALDRSLSALGETEIFLQPCRLSQAFVDHVAVEGLLANAGPLRALARGAASGDAAAATAADGPLQKLTTAPGLVYTLALARGLWSPVRNDVYLDRPNVLAYHQLLRQDAGGRPVAYEGFDIVTNDVAVRPGAADPRGVRVRQGVADTAAEAALARGAGGTVENTSDLFASAMAADAQWETLRAGGQPAPAALQVPDDVRARIERDLAEGQVVLAPKAAAPRDGRVVAAWWRIDPHTGTTLGIGQDGWGQTAAERALVHARVMLKAMLALKCMGSAVSGRDVAMCAAVGAVGAIGIGVGGFGGGVISYAADILSAMK